jgi:hypothetical protein
MNRLNREPIAIANGLLALLVALLGLLSTFNIWTPTGEQLASLSAFYVAAAGLVIFWLRGAVYSPAAVQTISDSVELVRSAPDGEAAELADEALVRLLPPPSL